MTPLTLLKGISLLYAAGDAPWHRNTVETLKDFFGEVITVEPSAASLQTYTQRSPHVVLVEVSRRNSGGLELATQIRAKDPRVIIIGVGNQPDADQLVQAMRLNFADFLSQPFAFADLKSMALRCGQRIMEEGSTWIRLNANVRYCRIRGAIERDGEQITLTSKEATLLELLIKHRGRWVPKERIASTVWSSRSAMSESALKNLLLKLRNKLGAEQIVNAYNLGYMLRE